MLTLGITGGPGTGKSTVLGVFKKRGIKTFSSDSMVRSLQRKGSPLLLKIKKSFGKEFLSPSGQLKRAKLRKLIFENDKAKSKLEKLLHPLVNKKRREIIHELEKKKTGIVVFEVPLLFEVKLEKQFDHVIVVASSIRNQIERLTKRWKTTQDEALSIITSQMPLTHKIKRADFVINNNNSKKELQKKTLNILKKLTD